MGIDLANQRRLRAQRDKQRSSLVSLGPGRATAEASGS